MTTRLHIIATYLLTAREQLNYYTVTACIVCNYGVSVAQLICEKLKYRFPNIHVTDVLSYEKFRQICQDGGGSWGNGNIHNRPAGGKAACCLREPHSDRGR